MCRRPPTSPMRTPRRSHPERCECRGTTHQHDGAHLAYGARASGDFRLVLDGQVLNRLPLAPNWAVFSPSGERRAHVEMRPTGDDWADQRIVLDDSQLRVSTSGRNLHAASCFGDTCAETHEIGRDPPVSADLIRARRTATVYQTRSGALVTMANAVIVASVSAMRLRLALMVSSFSASLDSARKWSHWTVSPRPNSSSV